MLERVKLINYRKHASLEVRFRPGLNVIIGQFTQGDREAQRLALDLLQTRQALTDVITQQRAQFLKGVP